MDNIIKEKAKKIAAEEFNNIQGEQEDIKINNIHIEELMNIICDHTYNNEDEANNSNLNVHNNLEQKISDLIDHISTKKE